MNRKLLAVLIFCALSSSCYAQIAKDFMVGAGIDLIKADYDDFFQRVQGGVEFNYYVTRDFTATAGVDAWSEEGVSAVIGTRWYPTREAFVRLRGLVGKANDVVVGGGWAKPLNNNFYFEAFGDYYFDGQFAIRAGFSYLIKRK